MIRISVPPWPVSVKPAPAEGTLRYEGWRVAGASAVGVFVSFASLLAGDTRRRDAWRRRADALLPRYPGDLIPAGVGGTPGVAVL